MICQTCKQPIVGPARVTGPLTQHQTVAACVAALLGAARRAAEGERRAA